jgi:hypothetical protein
MEILNAELKNGGLKISFNKQNIPAIVKILRNVLLTIEDEVKESELKDLSDTEIKIIVKNQEAEVYVKGDKPALYNLIMLSLGELNKTLDNTNLLNKVQIRADYGKKYSEWVRNLIQEQLSKQDFTEADIQDERAFIDENENLVIEVGIKNKKFHFEIPKEAWSF